MCLNPRKCAAIVCCGLFLVMARAEAQAQEFRLIPGVSLKQEFNDNIFFSSGDTTSSFISTVSPKLSLVGHTERVDARIDANLDILFYTADSHQNRVDQNYQAHANYQLTPRFKLGGEAGYSLSSRADSNIETTGQVTTQGTGTEQQRYSLTGDLTVSEKLAGTLAYNYEQTDYSPTTASNSQTHGANLGLIYDMGTVLPLLKLRGNLGYNTNRFSGFTVDTYSATTGFSYAFHELWSVQADAGGIYTSESATVQPAGINTINSANNGLGWTAALIFAYKGEKDSASLNFSRGVQSSYGSTGVVERTSVIMTLNRRFTYELSGAISAGYYLNNSIQNQFAGQATDSTTFRVSPSLRYEFNPDIAVDGNYEFAMVQNHQAGTDALRNLVYIRLTVQYPLFE